MDNQGQKSNASSFPKISPEELDKAAAEVEFQIDKPLQRHNNISEFTQSTPSVTKEPARKESEETFPQSVQQPVTESVPKALQMPEPRESYTTRVNRELPQAQPASVAALGEQQKKGGQTPAEPEKKKPPITRTFQSDIANLMKQGDVSVSKIAIAESQKRQAEMSGIFSGKHNPEHTKNILIGWASIALIVGGFAALVFIFLSGKSDTAPPEALVVPSMIFVGGQTEIDVTGHDRDELLSAITKEITGTDIRLNTIRQLYFIRLGVGNVKEILPADVFFGTLMPDMPAILRRSLTGDYLLGVHAFNGNTPFLVTQIVFFDNAFSGMLKWEKALARDILPMFGELVSVAVSQKRFEDAVFKNRDVRVLRDDNGLPILLYMFPTSDTLVITTDLNTLDEVVQRLLTSR